MTTLRKGSTGDEVMKLQQLLGITADGIFGKNTERAVMDFQKRNGLSVDGKAGEKTLEKLFSDGAKMSKEMEDRLKAEALALRIRKAIKTFC